MESITILLCDIINNSSHYDPNNIGRCWFEDWSSTLLDEEDDCCHLQTFGQYRDPSVPLKCQIQDSNLHSKFIQLIFQLINSSFEVLIEKIPIDYLLEVNYLPFASNYFLKSTNEKQEQNQKMEENKPLIDMRKWTYLSRGLWDISHVLGISENDIMTHFCDVDQDKKEQMVDWKLSHHLSFLLFASHLQNFDHQSLNICLKGYSPSFYSSYYLVLFEEEFVRENSLDEGESINLIILKYLLLFLSTFSIQEFNPSISTDSLAFIISTLLKYSVMVPNELFHKLSFDLVHQLLNNLPSPKDRFVVIEGLVTLDELVPTSQIKGILVDRLKEECKISVNQREDDLVLDDVLNMIKRILEPYDTISFNLSSTTISVQMDLIMATLNLFRFVSILINSNSLNAEEEEEEEEDGNDNQVNILCCYEWLFY